MKFNLTKPCSQCPFANKCRKGWLGRKRAQDIANGVLHEDKTFTCHKTLDRKKADQSHCYGALVLVEKLGKPNNMLRIAGRLQLYKPLGPHKWHNDVFETEKAMVDHHE